MASAKALLPPHKCGGSQHATQSNAHHAAIDEQLYSANEAAVVRGQEYGGVGDIHRSSNLSGGYQGDEMVPHLGDNSRR
jgi:hypothetical protein